MIRILRIVNRFNIGGPTYNATFLTRYLSDEFETLLIGGLPEEGEADSLYILKEYGVEPLLIPELKRTVRFYISSKNQFRISKWEESYPTVFDGVLRTSTYELKGVKYIPYWKNNKAEYIDLRKDLKLND